MTVREFLQKLGTDAMRNGLHEHVWVNAFWSDYKKPIELGHSPRDNNFKYPNWIITDVRFPNEAQSVKDRDGLMIRINRPNPLIEAGAQGDEKAREYITEKFKKLEHPSETGLDDYDDFDYVINNSGTLEDLIEMVREILIKEKII